MNRKVLVGMLLLGALIIFALATFYIENWQFFLQKGYKLYADFENAQNLEEGDEVRLTGVKVGRIHTITVDNEGTKRKPVRIVLWMNRGIKIRANDVAHIETRSVFGGSLITITRGDAEARVLKAGEAIEKTEVEPTITDVIAKADFALGEAGKAAENVKGSLDSAKNAFDGIEKVTKEVREGKGLLSKLMTDEKLANDASDTFASIKKISSEIEQGKGTAGRLLTDDKLYEDLRVAAAQGREAFEKIREIADQAKEGKGILAKLLSDEKMSNDLSQFLTSLGKISDKLETSTVGKLTTSDETYKKLNDLLDSLSQSAKEVTEGKGTLGLLMKDDKVYKQVGAALESVQRLLDDYREQSPVLTFAGAVFGAF